MGLITAMACWLLAAAGDAGAQSSPTITADSSATILVLMLSDLHFDPFRDPAKVARLAATPVAGWEAILSEPDSSTQAASFAALQSTCSAKSLDTDHALLLASLKAAKAQTTGLKFVTISGDMLVHQFDCRYQTLMKIDAYTAFAGKTASYVIRLVEAEFPGVPVYVALGNNDSGCGDYKLDVQDHFFAGTSQAVLEGLRGAGAAELKQAREDYETGGYFAVNLPQPMRRTRLLVLDDIFLSRKYTTCASKADATGMNDAMAWLTRELDGARQRGEQVWMMAHIPMGIDVYSTLRKGKVCDGSAPETFLSPAATNALTEVLAAHDDVVKLAIFGHTHMDEIKLIPGAGKEGGVPAKGVASISPVDGNMPSFTVARIDPAKATMDDYAVFVATERSGGAWTREYGFQETYHEPSYSAAALAKIAAGFDADPSGTTAASKAYEKFFDPGFPISPLIIAWPQYACGIAHPGEAGFKACACAARQ